MFELDQAIANWRRGLAKGGVRSPAILDELESHLREEICRQVSDGTPEAEAFRLATSRLGEVKPLTVEFQKLNYLGPITLKLSILLSSLAVLACLVFAIRLPGKSSFVLAAHVLTLTLGDVMALFAGGLGICYICALRLHKLSLGQAQSLSCAAALCNEVSAWLVVTGLLFGLTWNARARGYYLSADPREIGTVCTAMWLITFCLAWRLGRMKIHTTMLLCVAGNCFISLAWFGAGLISHGNGVSSSWQLNTALAINLLFLAWGLGARYERMAAYV